MKISPLRFLSGMLCAALACAISTQAQSGPRVLATSDDREAIAEKIRSQPWARECHAAIKARVDACLARVRGDPQWLVSRLFLHWETHATTAIVKSNRWAGAEGRAPSPTVRFAGARDWVATHSAPADIAGFRPYNDRADGAVWLINNTTKKGEWANPGTTGRVIESANARIMQLAADAAFLYWLSGDESYARMSADVLCAYIKALSLTGPPRILDAERGGGNIIGTTSFEVIHDEILTHLGIAYDFLRDFLKKDGRDTALIQTQLKRMIDRIVEGGSAEGNWNLNQAWLITAAALALDSNTAFADGRGREHYAGIILNADLPRQRGLLRVIREGYDQETAVWPEAPDYGAVSTLQIVRIATLLAGDRQGRALLDDPMLARAAVAQAEMTHPNGWSTGLGDTYQMRISAPTLELLIAHAQKSGARALEEKLTALLRREIDGGFYRREKLDHLLPLTRYAGVLTNAGNPAATSAGRAFFAKPLNAFFMRNFSPDNNPAHALSAVIYGTDGAHVHANGLAIELYGAGVIQGADPGRGSSYWQAEHREYYSQPPAHNTVVVNGRSKYPTRGPGRKSMTLDHAEPIAGARALSANVAYAQASFEYDAPVAAQQQRTLAIVRTDDGGGLYFDVFRSRAVTPPGVDGGGAAAGFHDYIYHNIGEARVCPGFGKNAPGLSPSSDLSQPGGALLEGYSYFKNERSCDVPENAPVFAAFEAGAPAKHQRAPARAGMNFWMAGAAGEASRRVYSVSAPPCRGGRDSLSRHLDSAPMPALIVRQSGEAWRRPFVAIYEPVENGKTPAVKNVERLALPRAAAEDSLAACRVSMMNGDEIIFAQSDQPERLHEFDGYSFRAALCVMTAKRAGTQELEIYLGQCRSFSGAGGISVVSDSGAPADVSLRRKSDGTWRYSANAPVRVTVPAGDGKMQAVPGE